MWIPGIVTKHNAAVRRADHFELVRHHGSYRCAGMQGSIAGFPCDVLIIDDPYKDHLDAHSLVVREAVWNKKYGDLVRCKVRLAPDPNITVTYECKQGFTCKP